MGGFSSSFFSRKKIGNGPNTVSESTASDTELSEFFGPHRVRGGELSELLSAYYLCAKVNSPSLSQNSASLPQNSVSSLFRNSTLETVFRPFPRKKAPTIHQKNTLKICRRSSAAARGAERKGRNPTQGSRGFGAP